MPIFHALRPLALVAFIALATAPGWAQDGAAGPGTALPPAPPNPVCGTFTAGQFKLAEIGPAIAGAWQGTAPGIGMTAGVQTFTVAFSFERGRLYASGDGGKVELKPIYRNRKALRWDPVRQMPLPETAHAVAVTPQDVALVAGCELDLAPQFSWTLGSGAQTASGIYSFFGPDIALGTMWNSARGAREVYLTR